MNYDLSFVTSNGSDLQNIISLLESMTNILTTSNNNLRNNWKGISYNKYNGLNDSLKGRYQEKINELNGVIGLLNLIARHNRLREERISCQNRINSLRPHLYYEEVDEEGNVHTHFNEHVAREINALEQRINEINRQMDEVINSIKGITGG